MSRLMRLTLATLLLAATGCASSSPATRGAQGERHWNDMRGRVKLRLAQRQFAEGLFAEAAVTLSDSIGLSPAQSEAYALLAKVHLECARPASAQQALDAAAQAGLKSGELKYMQGVLFEQQGRVAEALTEFSRAQAMDPTGVDALIAQAQCLVALSRADEAAALLDEHASRFDDEASVAVMAAHVAALRGDSAEALNRYRQARVTLGDDELIGEELGLLLADAKRYSEAISVLKPLVEQAASEPQALACANDPNDECSRRLKPAARRALAMCYLESGNAQAAKRILAPYAATRPEDTLAQLLLAKAALASDDLLTALRAVDLARQRRPHHPEVLLVQATMQWRRGKLTTAASSLEELLTHRPRDLDALCLLGEVRRAMGQPEQARAEFQEALEIDRQCAWAIVGLDGTEHETLSR